MTDAEQEEKNDEAERKSEQPQQNQNHW